MFQPPAGTQSDEPPDGPPPDGPLPGGPLPGGSLPDGSVAAGVSSEVPPPPAAVGAASEWAGLRAGAGFGEGGVLDRLAPGPVLAWCTQRAFDEGLGALSDDELVGLLGSARRLSSWQAAVECHAVAELDRRRRDGAGVVSSRTGEQVSCELAAALTLTSRLADELLSLSRELARLPMVRAALFAGVIDRAKAMVFARELAGLSDVAACAVGAVMWQHAATLTTGQLRAELRSLVLSLDPAAVKRRAAKARGDARVELWPETSGNTGLAGRELAAADAVVADQRITAVARALQAAGAEGSLDQLRAAVFVALLTGQDLESLRPAAASPGAAGAAAGPGAAGPGAASAGAASAAAGPGAASAGAACANAAGRAGAEGLAALAGSVHLTMPASAWLGESEVPGEAAGYGPLDADTCRDLAGRLEAGPGTRWSVTLTDAAGRAVAHARARHGPGRAAGGLSRRPGQRSGPDAGFAVWLASLDFDWLESGSCGHWLRTRRYRPGAKLARLVKIRQRTCVFPGCRRPARQCDLDHTVPFDQGGPTCQCNLAALCRRHHQAKQAPGWRLAQPEPGVMVWSAPHGRSYRVQSPAYRM